MGHIHEVADKDPHFTVDPATRIITNNSATKTALMQYDHNSERFTFDVPRHIDDHDLSLCDRVEVHYINIGSNGRRNSDVYPVDDLAIHPGDDTLITFTWLVSSTATSHEGSLSFVLRFICGSEGAFDYIWNTAIYSGISIGKGMDNAETVVTQYADILGAWYNEFIAAGNERLKQLDQAKEEAISYMEDKAEEIVEDEAKMAIATIQVQADEIVNLVLERLPRAEEASF